MERCVGRRVCQACYPIRHLDSVAGSGETYNQENDRVRVLPKVSLHSIQHCSPTHSLLDLQNMASWRPPASPIIPQLFSLSSLPGRTGLEYFRLHPRPSSLLNICLPAFQSPSVAEATKCTSPPKPHSESWSPLSFWHLLLDVFR